MSQGEAASMGIWLAANTVVRKHSTPLKGNFWDCAIIGVSAPLDDDVWAFPKNSAVVMLVSSGYRPPHGIHVHRLFVRDQDPFDVGIAIVAKDTVKSVSSELSLAWPDHAAYMAYPADSPTRSIVCPGFHRVRLQLHQESFWPNMTSHIDVGIVIAAERFTPALWEQVTEPMKHCDVCVVSTRGGGDMCAYDKHHTEVSGWFSRGCRTAVNVADSDDKYTAVGHTDPLRANLSARGTKFRQNLPMVWLSCHHSVRQFPYERRRDKGKGNGKGKGVRP